MDGHEFQKGKACSVLSNMIEAACGAPGRIVHLACREVVGEGREGEQDSYLETDGMRFS